jgi:hypothetical protein
VIGDDNSSGALAAVSSGWPSTDAFGLNVRIIGSSGDVLGSIAQSSNWNISTGAVVGLTTTATVGLTTTSLVGLSSAISNYVTNSTTVPVYLGQSSGNVVGIISQSSNWNISTGAVVGLTTTSVIGLTTTSLVGLSSAISNYVTNSTTVPVYLGQSSALVVGVVAQSSNWNISTGAVVALTTTSVVGLTTTAIVGLTTTSLVGLSSAAASIISQTTAGAVGSSAVFAVGGIVASTANTNATMSSGMIQLFQVDRSGALTVNLEGPRQFVKTARTLTAANTSFQQIIAAPGASLVADIVKFQIWTTAISDLTIVTSSGSTAAAWEIPLLSSGADWLRVIDFPIPLTQSGSNIAWGIYCTGSASKIMVQYVVGTS